MSSLSGVMIVMAISTISPDAHAYLDPATGGSIIQTLIIGGSGAIVLFWDKIKSLILKIKNKMAERRKNR